jgi:hypothetical protein
VHCAAPLCAACITKIDGINHCQSCLAALAERHLALHTAPQRASAPARWLGVGLGAALLSVLGWRVLETLFRGAP